MEQNENKVQITGTFHVDPNLPRADQQPEQPNQTEQTDDFRLEFAEKVSKLIDYPLEIKHIHSDEPGWDYYIRNLRPGWPLLLIHYRGPLMAVIPAEDYRKLQSGHLSVDQYIVDSRFSYGYFRGGGDILNGVYWQPFELSTGIHFPDLIGRYLRIMNCRMCRSVSGHRPEEFECQACPLEQSSCPFSPFNETGTWEREIQEKDRRAEMLSVIRERILTEMGFHVVEFMPHDFVDKFELQIFPSFQPNTVGIRVHTELLNELLYQIKPVTYWRRLHWSAIQAYPYHPNEKVSLGSTSDKRQTCLDLWGSSIDVWDKASKLCTAGTERMLSGDAHSRDITTQPAANRNSAWPRGLAGLISDACGAIRKLLK